MKILYDMIKKENVPSNSSIIAFSKKIQSLQNCHAITFDDKVFPKKEIVDEYLALFITPMI